MLTSRADLLARLEQNEDYDLAVVGGGATGLGVALDAAARGLRVILLESHDFAQGTSSRATKLLHGGVRYLAQGDFSLVYEALHERRTLLDNAPHLARPLAFVVPLYRRWHQLYYGAGLCLYEWMAGATGLGPTRFLSRAQTIQELPNVRTERLCGAIRYWDGQFDDARMALALARTASRHAALMLNYCSVDQLAYDASPEASSGAPSGANFAPDAKPARISGLQVTDTLTGRRFDVRARCVVNATGVWVDGLRLQDAATRNTDAPPERPMVAPSQGVHIVLDGSFLDSCSALMVPATRDGRVLFLVPWLGKTLLGTTDTPRHDLAREPEPFAQEVDFLLQEAACYLRRAPQRSDIRSIWVGLRPLAQPADATVQAPKALSRKHAIKKSETGLVSVTGGKWTTYRAMAEDVLAHCMNAGLIPSLAAGVTRSLPLVGATVTEAVPQLDYEKEYVQAVQRAYGADWALVQALPGSQNYLSPGFSEAMVRFAARHEYALRVEDVLARRHRLLFLDAALASRLAPATGEILFDETGIDPRVADFQALAANYLNIP